VAKISVQPPKVKRKFDGLEYVLTKINYTRKDAADDQAYHQARGRETRILEEDGFWLLYTKVGQ
jgi:hypothetical protein